MFPRLDGINDHNDRMTDSVYRRRAQSGSLWTGDILATHRRQPIVLNPLPNPTMPMKQITGGSSRPLTSLPGIEHRTRPDAPIRELVTLLDDVPIISATSDSAGRPSVWSGSACRQQGANLDPPSSSSSTVEPRFVTKNLRQLDSGD